MNLDSQLRTIFNNSASSYDDTAVVPHEIGVRLVEQLQYLTMKPLMILDLGCGTGALSVYLKKKYPKAMIVGLDFALGMLKQARSKQNVIKKWSLVCADMNHIPFASESFDLIIANQVIGFSQDMSHLFRELNRVLKVNGCLMFSTLGPDSLKEIQHLMPEEKTRFLDMHLVGDALLKEQFIDPVVDSEYLTAHHTRLERMITALQAYGLTLDLTDNHDLTYEIIYGHAWKGAPRQISSGSETFIPVSSLMGRR